MDAPVRIPLPFAASAAAPYINDIPTASQIGITNGAASFSDGFPPNCFVTLSSGGAGPFGRDFNGLLNQVTSGLQWTQAGGKVPWDSTFASDIGGYPLGAVIPRGDGEPGYYWFNLLDNNPSNPDAAGSFWGVLRMPGYNAPLEVPYGGTGRATLTAFAILAGNVTTAIGQISPGATDLPLCSNGASAFASFRALNLTSAVVGKLRLTNSPLNPVVDGSAAPGVHSFTVSADTYFLCGCVVGGGGGGAAGNGTYSGGGGGAGGMQGGPTMGWFAVMPGDVISYTVADGGAAGTGGGDGGNGGAIYGPSTIGSYLSATGGAGGISSTGPAGGNGGVGAFTAGIFNCYGGNGGEGSAAGNTICAGDGGVSFFGGGSMGHIGTTGANGAPGAGGGGGYNNADGYPGLPGMVLVWG